MNEKPQDTIKLFVRCVGIDVVPFQQYLHYRPKSFSAPYRHPPSYCPVKPYHPKKKRKKPYDTTTTNYAKILLANPRKKLEPFLSQFLPGYPSF